MTHVIYKKNDTWVKSYKDLDNGKYDDILYIEMPDSLPDEYQRTDFSIAELLDFVDKGFGCVGMYGLKEHPEWVSSLNIKAS